MDWCVTLGGRGAALMVPTVVPECQSGISVEADLQVARAFKTCTPSSLTAVGEEAECPADGTRITCAHPHVCWGSLRWPPMGEFGRPPGPRARRSTLSFGADWSRASTLCIGTPVRRPQSTATLPESSATQCASAAPSRVSSSVRARCTGVHGSTGQKDDHRCVRSAGARDSRGADLRRGTDIGVGIAAG